uniref:CX domain-containing protein n=1 Tax=Globodera pallida TaxID=36090 RepID=A0A183CTG4_GLOPA
LWKRHRAWLSRAESFKSSFVSSSAANTYYHNQPFYYYGNHYYLGGDGASKVNAGEIQCKMLLDTLFNQNAPLSNSSKLINETWPATWTNGTFSMTNGTRPKYIVWTCKEHVEQCCGIECCPTSAAEGANDGTAVVELVFILLGGVIVMVWYWVIQNF